MAWWVEGTHCSRSAQRLCPHVPALHLTLCPALSKSFRGLGFTFSTSTMRGLGPLTSKGTLHSKTLESFEDQEEKKKNQRFSQVTPDSSIAVFNRKQLEADRIRASVAGLRRFHWDLRTLSTWRRALPGNRTELVLGHPGWKGTSLEGPSPTWLQGTGAPFIQVSSQQPLPPQCLCLTLFLDLSPPLTTQSKPTSVSLKALNLHCASHTT